MIFGWLLFLFIAVPLAELALLLKVNEHLGWQNTLALVILTGFVGAVLAKAQGMAVVSRIQEDMREGRMPAPRLMDGVMILIAGALLVTPGLMTDTVGFLLLVPPVRAGIRRYLKNKIEQQMRTGHWHMDIRR
jgi:UPF0716 protein FxsA